MAAAIEARSGVKGWCPGVLRPMQSGDGLIVRVRPRLGAFSLDEARALADLAGRLGNGHIDLTRRANLQIRGVEAEALSELQAALGQLGLVDRDAETEAVRNVMVAPLAAAGSDVRRIAMAVEALLASDRRLLDLPTKFGLSVDEGGPVSIASERADICLRAVGEEFAVGLDGREGMQWLGTCAPDAALNVVSTAMHAFLDCAPRRRLRDLPGADLAKVQAAVSPLLSKLPSFETIGGRVLGLVQNAVGIAAPFGRLEAIQLRRLADLATMASARELHLSPWRTIYVTVRDAAAGRALLDGAEAIGLIVRDDDPVLRIEACPGAPDCTSSSVDARGDARRLAELASAKGFNGSLHVSGCAKGCARSAPSDLVLVGDGGRYHLIRHATTRGPAERSVDADDLASVFPENAYG
jgi:precorrin-3B synthase